MDTNTEVVLVLAIILLPLYVLVGWVEYLSYRYIDKRKDGK